jgi:hypothetical protein
MATHPPSDECQCFKRCRARQRSISPERWISTTLNKSDRLFKCPKVSSETCSKLRNKSDRPIRRYVSGMKEIVIAQIFSPKWVLRMMHYCKMTDWHDCFRNVLSLTIAGLEFEIRE